MCLMGGRGLFQSHPVSLQTSWQPRRAAISPGRVELGKQWGLLRNSREPAARTVCNYSVSLKKKVQINLRSPFSIKLFKKYLLTVHLEGNRHINLLAVGNWRGDMLTHTFLSALGKTTLI